MTMSRRDQIRDVIERIAAHNVYAARGLAREDPTIDVNEDDFRRDEDVQSDDDAAGTHDA